MKKIILSLLMIIVFLEVLAQNTQIDTICVNKQHYKTLLKIAASENTLYQLYREEQIQSNKYKEILNSTLNLYEIKTKQYDECLDNNHTLTNSIEDLNNKLKKKNKKLLISYSIISSYLIYQSIKIYIKINTI